MGLLPEAAQIGCLTGPETARRYDLGDKTWHPHHPPLFQTCKRARLARGVDLGRQNSRNSWNVPIITIIAAADDAKCATVVPQKVNIFVRREVWRHAEVGCTRNRTIWGQQQGQPQSAPGEPGRP